MSGLSINALLNHDNEPFFKQKVVANGREYYRWSRGTYPYPCDEEEQTRLDLLNHMIWDKALKGRFTVQLAPEIGKRRVLDVGCGTGWWVQRIGEQYPDSEVIGIDIACHQPTFGSEPNITYLAPVDFTSAYWGVQPSSFHLVHGSLLCGSVANWVDLYRKMHGHLVLGGYVELIELDWQPRCNAPNPGREDALAFHTWWVKMVEATRHIGMPIEYRQDTGLLLSEAGFVDIQERPVVHVPCSASGSVGGPIMSPEYAMARGLEETLRTAMGWLASKPWSGMSMELFTQHLGMSRAEVEHLGDMLVDAMNRPQSPFYFQLHVWTARKPMHMSRV